MTLISEMSLDENFAVNLIILCNAMPREIMGVKGVMSDMLVSGKSVSRRMVEDR